MATKWTLLTLLCLLPFHGLSFHSSLLKPRVHKHSSFHIIRKDDCITRLLSTQSSEVQSIIKYKQDKESKDFDLQLALLLAGFSFEAYNERIVGKRTLGLDNTVINFTSSSFIRSIFSAVLLLTLRRGQLQPSVAKEEQLAERIATGAEADPYITIHIQEDGSKIFDSPLESKSKTQSIIPAARVWDSWTSSVKMNSNQPEWNETALLYIRDPSQSFVAFTVRDKDLFKADDFIGTGLLNISELLSVSENHNSGSGSGSGSTTDKSSTNKSNSNSPSKPVTIKSLMIPIYGKRVVSKSGFLHSFFSTQSSPVTYPRVGTAEVDIQYIAFQDNVHHRQNADTNNVQHSSTSSSISNSNDRPGVRRLPKGGTDALDWATLLNLHSTVTQSTAPVSASSSRNTVASHEKEPTVNEYTSLGEALINSIQHRNQSSHSEIGLHQVCSIDNTDTDTQASVWVDFETKQLVIAFRGTEQIKFKDVLTDINLLQVPYQQSESNPKLQEILIHNGFLTAFLSVRDAILQLLSIVLTHDTKNISSRSSNDGDHNSNNSNTPWSIFITGHSLGGALATLLSFELGRMAAGVWGDPVASPPAIERVGYREYYSPPEVTMEFNVKKNDAKGKVQTASTPAGDTASIYRNDPPFLTALQAAKMCTYTFGAPRVGNPAFAQLYDELAPHCFRVVNDKDLVARIPRSSQTNRLLQYEHVGRAAVVGSAELGPLHITASVGSSPITVSTTREVAPSGAVDLSALDRLRTEGVEVIQQWLGTGSRTNSSKTEESLLVKLSDSIVKGLSDGWSLEEISSHFMSGSTAGTNNSVDVSPLSSPSFPSLTNATSLVSSMITSAIEPEKSFIDKEVKLLQSILDGRALEHHLEPSYYQALEAVISQQVPQKKDI